MRCGTRGAVCGIMMGLYGLLRILETRAWTLRLVNEGAIIPGDTNGSHQSGATAMGFSFSVDFGHNVRPSISTPQ